MKGFAAVSSSFPVRTKCLAEPLVGGEEFFASLEKEIAASSSLAIALSFCSADNFRYPGGRLGESGKHVFILAWNNLANPIFDGILNDTYLPRLEKLGLANLHIRWTDSAPDKQHCHHEKSFVLDHGRVAFTGGIIVSPNWTKGGFMHDIGVKIQGQASVDVYQAFCERWSTARGKRLNADMEMSEPLDVSKSNHAGVATVQVCRSLRPGLVTVTGEASIVELWMRAIRNAKRSLFVEQQHLAHEQLFGAIIDALGRGVRVIYVRPGHLDAIYCDDKDPARLPVDTYRGRTKPMYERVFLEQMPQFDKAGGILCALFDVESNHKIHVHSKALIVDEEYYLVGSANLVDISMDLDAGDLHTEICVGVHDPPVAKRLQQKLLNLHSGVSDDISMDDFVSIATENGRLLAQNEASMMRGSIYRMNPTAWGRAILSQAVWIYETARK